MSNARFKERVLRRDKCLCLPVFEITETTSFPLFGRVQWSSEHCYDAYKDYYSSLEHWLLFFYD